MALLASGVFSLEVGGPLVGQTDETWVNTVTGLLKDCNYEKLAQIATEERLISAGNVSGELLCWITMSGALGDNSPLFVETDHGSGFAAWNLE